MTLPTNIDVTYGDDAGDASVKLHQQHHDAIHAFVNGGGVPIVRAFPFAYNTAGLVTGHNIYTPTVGDILLDAWFEITTAWDGTTPFADIGRFTNAGQDGWFAGNNAAVPLSDADGGGSGSRYEGLHVSQHLSDLHLAGIYLNGAPDVAAIYGGSFRIVPAKFLTADPIKVVVSQDGTATGASPAATQGAATLYLVTATPI